MPVGDSEPGMGETTGPRGERPSEESRLFQAEELERIGLGLPAAERMARRLREAGVPVGEDVFLTVDELAGALSAPKGVRL